MTYESCILTTRDPWCVNPFRCVKCAAYGASQFCCDHDDAPNVDARIFVGPHPIRQPAMYPPGFSSLSLLLRSGAMTDGEARRIAATGELPRKAKTQARFLGIAEPLLVDACRWRFPSSRPMARVFDLAEHRSVLEAP